MKDLVCSTAVAVFATVVQFGACAVIGSSSGSPINARQTALNDAATKKIQESRLPICVDLDGTLIENDVTNKAMGESNKRDATAIIWRGFKGGISALVSNPAAGFGAAISKGTADGKNEAARRYNLNATELRYNIVLLDFLMQKKSQGCQVYLVSGCPQEYADAVKDYLGTFGFVFDDAFGTGEKTGVNLVAGNKANFLENKFGSFVYAGNSKKDIDVWKKSAECIVVKPDPGVLEGFAKKIKDKGYMLFDGKEAYDFLDV